MVPIFFATMLFLGAGAETTAVRAPAADAPAPSTKPTPGAWPLPATLHPLAVELRAAPLATVAARLKRLAPAERVKALHDWVTLVLDYDAAMHGQAAATGSRATCEGYTGLFEATGRAAGLEVETVRGLFKTPTAEPQGHAWNAVKLGGQWALVDVTLDDPTMRGDAGKDAGYRTDYLLTPPELFALDHWPFEPRWQLTAEPRPPRAQFAAAPRLKSASLERAGLAIAQAPRLEEGRVTVRVDARAERYLLLALDGKPCGAATLATHAELTCEGHLTSASHLELLAHTEASGWFFSVFEFSLPAGRVE